MPTTVNKVEITAALTPDYQAAYKAAAETMKSADSQLKTLEKDNENLIKIQRLGAQAAEERARGDLKAAAKSDAAYEKLKKSIEAAGGTIENVDEQLAKLAERRKGLEALSKAARQQAEFGKLANEIKRLETATKGVTDKANPMARALDDARKKASQMGLVLERTTKTSTPLFGGLREGVKGFVASMKEVPGPVGGVASSIDGLLPKITGKLGLVAGLAAVAVAAVKATKAVIGFGMESIQEGDELAKLTASLGIDFESYQKLAYAMERGGASASVFKDGMKTLVQRMEEVKNGNKGTAEMFSLLGVSIKEVKNLKPEEMMLRLSDAFKKQGDSAKVAKTANALFGGEGYRLASAARVGTDELARLGREAEDIGAIMSREQAEMAEKGADALTNYQKSLDAVKRQFGLEVMPVLIEGMNSVVELIKENKDAVRDVAEASAVLLKFVLGAAQKGVAAVKILVNGFEWWQDRVAETAKRSEEDLAALWGWIVDKWNALTGWYDSLVDLTARGIGTAVEWTRSALSTAWAWLVDKKDTVVAWFKSLPDLIADGISSAWAWLKSEANTIWTSIRAWFAELWNSIIDDVSSSPLVGDLLKNLKVDVPVAQAGGGAYGGVTINNTIDARGATPGAARAVSRAVTMSTDSAYQTMREGFAQARELQYSGAVR